MEISDVISLMRAVSENGLTSFKLEDGSVKLTIKKEKEPDLAAAAMAERYLRTVGDGVTAKENSTANQEKVPSESDDAVKSGRIVSSPLVGTFYNSASPESEPYVKEGDTVKKGQTLGIIEAMKLMNEIESEFDGIVEAVLADNESLVEYGQPLFRIR